MQYVRLHGAHARGDPQLLDSQGLNRLSALGKLAGTHNCVLTLRTGLACLIPIFTRRFQRSRAMPTGHNAR